jgi:hypothetical protein
MAVSPNLFELAPPCLLRPTLPTPVNLLTEVL